MLVRYVILAPHPDDEVIGCYRLLAGGQVSKAIYFFDTTLSRREEVKKCADQFSFIPIFSSVEDLGDVINEQDVLLVPNIRDIHVDHKKVNVAAKRLSNQKFYYSVDMNVPFDKLDGDVSCEKHSVLESIYPSQKSLFADHRYFLFESFLENDVQSYIYVTLSFEGFHRYDAAPDEVKFLRNLHRHVFHVKVKIQVFGNNRELEFILFKRQLESFIDSWKTGSLGSCEMIGERILDYLVSEYPNRNIYIDISEDGENGAEVNYEVWE